MVVGIGSGLLQNDRRALTRSRLCRTLLSILSISFRIRHLEEACAGFLSDTPTGSGLEANRVRTAAGSGADLKGVDEKESGNRTLKVHLEFVDRK